MKLLVSGFIAALIASACGGTPASTATSTATPSPTPIAAPVLQSPSASPTQGAVSTAVPLEALRAGSHYVLLRHGISDVGNEAPQTMLSDCSTQANLNEQTKRDLAQMGADLVKLGIAGGTVLSSPYCRTLETARIVFKREPTREDALLRGSYVPAPGQPAPASAAVRIEIVKKMLAAVPTAGTNVWLVTHGDVIRGATGLDVEMGETLVVRPDGKGGYSPIARILPLGWKVP